jgi:hypothetical protein
LGWLLVEAKKFRFVCLWAGRTKPTNKQTYKRQTRKSDTLKVQIELRRSRRQATRSIDCVRGAGGLLACYYHALNIYTREHNTTR